ncbi:MAG: ABC transporter ATP-binding protein [Magnetococcales bacterium]|nr:ABC transporter ATP-binding protein [Magnetococcales bacterium]
MSVTQLTWPHSRLHDALPLLARHVGFSSAITPPTALSEDDHSAETIHHWLENTATWMGVEFLAVGTTYPELETMLAHAGPAIIEIPVREGRGFLLLISGNRRRLTLLGEDGKKHKVLLKEVRELLTNHLEAPLRPAMEKMVQELDIPEHRREKIFQSLLSEQLSSVHIGRSFWLLRLSPADDFWKQLRHAGFVRKAAVIFTSTIAFQLLILLSWAVIGKSIIYSNSFSGATEIWSLLLLTAIPLQVFSIYKKNQISLDFGAHLRNRLLDGILQLKSEEVRHQGSGHFLGYIMDIEILEGQSLTMVFASLISFIQILSAIIILMLGAGGLLHGMLLLGYFIFLLYISYKFYLGSGQQLAHYRKMSCDLAERMIGHRTRLSQDNPKYRHTEEDALLARYIPLSKRQMKFIAFMEGVGRRGWLLLSIIALLPELTSAQPDIGSLAISLGGTLLAATALNQFVISLRNILRASQAWKQLTPLYHSSTRRRYQKPPPFIPDAQIDHLAKSNSLIQGEKLEFSYYNRTILNRCSLKVERGQRLLLEGPSGGGKSTLAALLAGLRQPKNGTVSLFGLNWEQLGEKAWRQRVVITPQFHENHVITDTFAFNLLMGRPWPPSRQDLLEARTICQELDLGDLLEKMPAGMEQMVGESGWRLSHGERSRLYIARTLLQKADLIILDESFAALDPKTLKIALDCVLRRSKTLLLITHP